MGKWFANTYKYQQIYFASDKRWLSISIYTGGWEKFNEIWLAEKGDFYSNLNKDDITAADYMHVKSVLKDFEIRKLKWIS